MNEAGADGWTRLGGGIMDRRRRGMKGGAAVGRGARSASKGGPKGLAGGTELVAEKTRAGDNGEGRERSEDPTGRACRSEDNAASTRQHP